jgi:MAP/microtubule affinity-regulating kinase
MPRDIGHGANEVIKGCLDASPANRWTIEMVDEIAWGVGWGNADVPTAEARPSSRGRQISDDGNRASHSLVRPSLDASRRRSLSRSARSASRAPLAMQRTCSGTSSSGTHISSDDNSSYEDSVVHSPDCQHASYSSRERGRGRTTSQHRAYAHSSLSWSRSPSKVPLTPDDHSALPLPKVADAEIREFSEAEHREAGSPSLEAFFTRGRKSSPRRIPGK